MPYIRSRAQQPEQYPLTRPIPPPTDDIVTRAAELFPGVEFTDDFVRALLAMEYSADPVFVTGEAGTGKSTLLQCFRSATSKKVAVLAPTGVAAVNVGGQTIHSFFRFPPTPAPTLDIIRVDNPEMYRALDAIVIDEVSMVRADLLDGIDRFLRVNGRDKHRPFGGLQLILFGDLFQLPPVVSTRAESAFIRREYESPFFFAAHALRELRLEKVRLTAFFRQHDESFIGLLNAIRDGTVDDDELMQLAERYMPDFEPPEDEAWITLTSTNRIADEINERKLRQLDARPFRFFGMKMGRFSEMEERGLPAPFELHLREGAQVMFVRNDPFRRWVNGTMGRVVELGFNEISVDIEDSGAVEAIEPVDWEMFEYAFDGEENSLRADVTGTYQQFPLRPAYALTIHRGQGKTFERAIVDLGHGAFAHGQAYVALSRVVSLDGLVLKSPLRQQDLIVDPSVLRFAEE